jgi:anaerobic ribonucleoside-triphosphate reductase activating protein
MRVAGLVQDSIVDGPGLRFVVFVQGCPHHCPGCHNPESHDPTGGEEMAVEEIAVQMLSNPLTDGLTISGGEPFDQAWECLALASRARRVGLNVWCYTGYTFEQLLENADALPLLEQLDLLVDGPFVESQKNIELRFRGSANQRVLDVPASLTARAAVWCDKYK